MATTPSTKAANGLDQPRKPPARQHRRHYLRRTALLFKIFISNPPRLLFWVAWLLTMSGAIVQFLASRAANDEFGDDPERATTWKNVETARWMCGTGIGIWLLIGVWGCVAISWRWWRGKPLRAQEEAIHAPEEDAKGQDDPNRGRKVAGIGNRQVRALSWSWGPLRVAYPDLSAADRDDDQE